MKLTSTEEDSAAGPFISSGENGDESSSGGNSVLNDDGGGVPARKKVHPSSFFSSSLNYLLQFRYVVCVLLMLHIFSSAAMRAKLGMAMVCMVNSSAVLYRAETNSNDDYRSYCSLNESHTATGSSTTDAADSGGYHGTFVWSETERAQLFGAIFYGTLVSMWWSGYVADHVIGPRRLLLAAVLLQSAMSLASPLLANWSFYAFFAGRFVMGIGEGFVYPSVTSAAARWFPPTERSTMAAIYTMGNQFADIAGLSISSRLCAMEDVMGGWPLIFLTFGFLGLTTCLLWLLLFTDDPAQNRWISAREKEHIRLAVAPLQKRNAEAVSKKCVGKKAAASDVPWRKMLTSRALYAAIMGHVGILFTIVLVQSYLPAYVREVLRLNLKNNGMFSTIPFFAILITKLATGWLSDLLKHDGLLSSTMAARLFQSVASFGMGTSLLLLGSLVDCRSPMLAFALLCAYGVCYAACISGFLTALLCMSPPHTGILFSLSFTIATMCSATAPTFVGALHKTGSLDEWRTIWTSVALVNYIAGLIFLLFGSADEQKWCVHDREGEENGGIKVEDGEGGMAERRRSYAERKASIISNL